MSTPRNQDFRTSYQPLNLGNIEEFDDNREDDDLSPEGHSDLIIHVVPQGSKNRWNHIEDLDSFFTRIYQYHQNNGLFCMMLQRLFELFVFVFVIMVIIFLIAFVNYSMLFGNTKHENEKVRLSDIVYPYSEAKANYGWKTAVFVIISSFFWLLRIGHIIIQYFHFCEIKRFYNLALGIQDSDLENVTWDEVQHRVMEVQVEQRMCIHKEALTEIDIYHRILRFTNYFVAMVNKDVIPLKLNVPAYGEISYLTSGLRYNIDKLLFSGPWAPFQNNWHLTDEYKQSENRHRLAEALSKRIFYFGLLNLFLSPLVLMWQILYVFYHHTELIKREPGALGSRKWSHYGEVYLRHFNELDHEHHARLSRGYRPASLYLNSFTSPSLAIICKHFAFVCGLIFVVLATLTIYDEDVIRVEHILTIMTVTGAAVALCHTFIPDENLVWCPELLLTRVLAEVHYLPDTWKGKAHTSVVRKSFSQLFQYRIVHIFEELVSPLMTPIMLCFVVRRKALDIVDFLRNFTVDVVGVGDICSFAQMDVRKHGSRTWQPQESDFGQPLNSHEDDPVMRADGGKTELSLLHFTLTNPKWKPPQESTTFLTALKTHAQRDFNALNTLHEENVLFDSINSVSLGGGLGTIGTSILRAPWMAAAHAIPNVQNFRGGVSHMEGSRQGLSNGVLGSVSHALSNSGPIIDPVLASRNEVFHDILPPHPQDMTAIDMGISTLYLHEMHLRNRIRGTYTDVPVVAGAGNYQASAPVIPADSPSSVPSIVTAGTNYLSSSQRQEENTPLLRNT